MPKGCRHALITINEVVTGKQLKSYPLRAGETQLNAALHDLRNGIYTYTLYVDDEPVATRKLSVVK